MSRCALCICAKYELISHHWTRTHRIHWIFIPSIYLPMWGMVFGLTSPRSNHFLSAVPLNSSIFFQLLLSTAHAAPCCVHRFTVSFVQKSYLHFNEIIVIVAADKCCFWLKLKYSWLLFSMPLLVIYRNVIFNLMEYSFAIAKFIIFASDVARLADAHREEHFECFFIRHQRSIRAFQVIVKNVSKIGLPDISQNVTLFNRF